MTRINRFDIRVSEPVVVSTGQGSFSAGEVNNETQPAQDIDSIKHDPFLKERIKTIQKVKSELGIENRAAVELVLIF